MSTLRALAAIALALPMLLLWSCRCRMARRRQWPVGTDIGTLYWGRDSTALQGTGIFALCRAELSHAGSVGRYSPAHRQFAGCRSLRQHARPRGRLPVCTRRGSRLVLWPARKAQPPARLSGGRRPCRGAWLNGRNQKGQPDPDGGSDDPSVARSDGGRRGKCEPSGDRDHSLGWHRNDPEGDAEPTTRAFSLAGLHQHCRTLQ